MKIIKFLYVAFSMLFFQQVFGQSSKVVHIRYNFQHIRDLNYPEESFSADYLLSVKDRKSRFLPFFIYENVQKKPVQKNVSSFSGAITVVGMPVLTISNTGAMFVEEVDKDLSLERIQADSRMVSKYFFTTYQIPKIAWKIENETRKVLNYHCQKAVGTLSGREYIAWFAKELPIADGPWKFSGLPGLILEIGDKNNEVLFKAVEIFRNDDADINSLIHGDNSIELSAKEFEQLRKKFEINPEDVARGFHSNTKVAIRNVQNAGQKTVRKIGKYNPIEK